MCVVYLYRERNTPVVSFSFRRVARRGRRCCGVLANHPNGHGAVAMPSRCYELHLPMLPSSALQSLLRPSSPKGNEAAGRPLLQQLAGPHNGACAASAE